MNATDLAALGLAEGTSSSSSLRTASSARSWAWTTNCATGPSPSCSARRAAGGRCPRPGNRSSVAGCSARTDFYDRYSGQPLMSNVPIRIRAVAPRDRNNGAHMTYVILQHCCNDAACVSACPVDCIHPRPDEPSYATTEMLYIDPTCASTAGPARSPARSIDPSRRRPGVRSSRLLGAECRFLPTSVTTATYSLSVPNHRTGVTATVRELRVAVVGSGPAGSYAPRNCCRAVTYRCAWTCSSV